MSDPYLCSAWLGEEWARIQWEGIGDTIQTNSQHSSTCVYTDTQCKMPCRTVSLSLFLTYSRVFALKIKRKEANTNTTPDAPSCCFFHHKAQVLLACRKDNRWLCCVGFLLVVRIVQTEQRERKEASPKKSALLWARSPRTFRHSPLLEGREHCPRLQQSLSFSTISLSLHADQKNTNTATVPPIVLIDFFLWMLLV